MADLKTRDSGIEQEPERQEEMDDDSILQKVREGVPYLRKITDGSLAKFVQKRHDRLDGVTRQRLAEIKVNYLRYMGNSFVQVHPTDSNRVFIPPGATSKRAPTINKIRRTVQRYVAQITADEPVMEGVPSSHRNESRDAAEAATAAIRGEWQRLNLQTQLERVMQFGAVMRSAFWFFQWDDMAGGEQKAQKFFDTDKGEKVLLHVDSDGNRVDDPADAATITAGDITVSVMTPANVRWSGGRYAHEAKEVIVSEIMPLRDVYDSFPKTKEVKVGKIVSGDHAPQSGMEWLQDLRGESERGLKRDFDEDVLGVIGNRVEDSHSVLDEKVVIRHFFLKPNRQYKKGYHVILAGDHVVHRGELRYGIIPIAHYKFLDELADPTGLSLVDLLKDPQELLDFVNGQILRYLQMMKRRWFVPMHSGVKSRDLMSPTRSIIEYNPQAGKPEPEIQPEIPNSMVQFIDRFDNEYDDQSGIHDTLQGKHVPGVSSGRHAEALRSGDETLLGLTRQQVKVGLEQSAMVILKIIKREWKMERRVRFLGSDRQYIDQAFKSTDFGGTGQVVLKNSTLLMLTPAQRLDTIMQFAESGALTTEEVRRLAPLGDVMGVSLTEDVHYQRARRQSDRFLKGPPTELTKARKDFEDVLKGLEGQQSHLARLTELGGDAMTVATAGAVLQESLAGAEAEWQAALEKYAFDHQKWEDRMDISRIHAQVHADSLADDKAEMFPEWWVDAFVAHTVLEWQLGFPEQAQAQQQGGGVASEPAGTSFEEEVPPAVSGTAP